MVNTVLSHRDIGNACCSRLISLVKGDILFKCFLTEPEMQREKLSVGSQGLPPVIISTSCFSADLSAGHRHGDTRLPATQPRWLGFPLG